MIELLRKRRSCRKFSNIKIEDDKLDILKEALLRAPTSRNFEPCEFIIVRDREMLQKLSVFKPHGAAFLKECDTAFVITGDEEKSDTCIEDCSIAAITLQYTAESLGLRSCWAQARLRGSDHAKDAEEHIRGLFGLPYNIRANYVVGIGYPAAKTTPRTSDSLRYEKLHTEKFGL